MSEPLTNEELNELESDIRGTSANLHAQARRRAQLSLISEIRSLRKENAKLVAMFKDLSGADNELLAALIWLIANPGPEAEHRARVIIGAIAKQGEKT